MSFKFPTTVDSIDDVPDDFRALYEVKEGETSATLIDALRARVEVGAGAGKALENERKARVAAENAAKAWKAKAKELFDVETVDALIEKHSELEAAHAAELESARAASGGKTDDASAKQLEQALAAKDRDWSKKLQLSEAKTKEALEAKDRMYSSLEKYMKKNAATAAIAGAKGRIKVLEPHVMSSLKLVDENGDYKLRVTDDDGEDRYNSDGKPMSVDGLVALMRASDDYGFAFEGDGATGSGSRQTAGSGKATGPNPWSKRSWNLTQQMQITKQNPARAKQLEAAAASEK